MRLSESHVHEFARDGYLLLPDVFSAAEIALLRREAKVVAAQDRPENLREPGSPGALRSGLSCHLHNEAYRRLSRHPRLVRPAQQLLSGDVYLHQFKINAKVAHDGAVWHWHQDFRTWHADDGMPEPRVINAGVFLDDVIEFNGPLIFMPGSHELGHLPATATPDRPAVTTYGRLAADAMASPYDRATIDRLGRRYGLVAPKGRAGSVLLFHGCILHGSAPNMSPLDRTMVLATYNHVENAIRKPTRPEFVALRDFKAIEPLADDCLSALAATSAVAPAAE